MTNSTNPAQAEEFNSLLTCTRLFTELQSLEPLLIKNRRIFITRNHRSTIQFRILNARGDTVYFTRTFDWKDHNTAPAIAATINQTYRDLIAANLIAANLIAEHRKEQE